MIYKYICQIVIIINLFGFEFKKDFMKTCKLDSLRGYSYKLPNSIINCPNYMEGGILMPLANSLQFFDGQKSVSIFKSKREISAVQLKGNLVSIGQKASPGQLISVMLFDLYNPNNIKTFNYQKTKINFIATSLDGSFFCTVGSSSQTIQQLTIIETQNQSEVGTKIFYSKTLQKQNSIVKALKFSNKDPHFFVLLRNRAVLLYRIDAKNGIVDYTVAKSSKAKEFNNFIFSPDDQYLYACSKNGDISQISIKQNKEVRIGPRKRVITKGITNIRYLQPKRLVITGKQGFLALVQLKDFNITKQIKLVNQIVCISEFSDNIAYITTIKADVYKFNALTFNIQLIYTSHCTKINALAILKDFSDVFGTAAGGQIVIWNTKMLTPILKIQFPKIICESLHFSKNGKYIISGWNDDTIRIFSPNNGKILHTISNCGLNIITAIISDDNSTQLFCGGENGIIRLWNLQQNKLFGLIIGSLSYHYKRIHKLAINPLDSNQLISSCQDGFYGIWNLKQFQLQKAIQMSSFLKQIHFESEYTIKIIGSGNIIFECNINDGTIIKQYEVKGSNINSMCLCFIQQSKEQFLFYANNSNYIHYFDQSTPEKDKALESFGQVTKMQLTSDKSHILAITQNGIILKYSLFVSPKH